MGTITSSHQLSQVTYEILSPELQVQYSDAHGVHSVQLKAHKGNISG